MSVPDVSVAGFDDALGELMRPGLTICAIQDSLIVVPKSAWRLLAGRQRECLVDTTCVSHPPRWPYVEPDGAYAR